MNTQKLSYQLIVLEAIKRQIIVINPNDYSTNILIEDKSGTPDGLVFNPNDQLLYWTNMGADYDAWDGYIQHCNLDGKDRGITVKVGETHTPKQIQLDHRTNYLYWCDREGMKIERCHIETGKVEFLLDTHEMYLDEDKKNRHCVGIALDIQNNRIFWTMKGPPKGGTGRLLCAPFDFKDKQAVIDPSQINVVYDHLPEPIDLEIDYENDYLYWSDRGAEPDGNSLNRLQLSTLSKKEVVIRGFDETIGFTVDADNQLAFVADKMGHVYQVNLQTKEKKVIFTSESGGFTGLIKVSDKG